MTDSKSNVESLKSDTYPEGRNGVADTETYDMNHRAIKTLIENCHNMWHGIAVC